MSTVYLIALVVCIGTNYLNEVLALISIRKNALPTNSPSLGESMLFTSRTSATAPSIPIVDVSTSCNVEQLETANDSQLNLILNELKVTSFFKNFAVDLDQSCSLWGKDKKKAAPPKEQSSVTTPPAVKPLFSTPLFGKTDDNEEEPSASCASDGIPDFLPEEHGGHTACGITSDGGDDTGLDIGQDFLSSASASSSPFASMINAKPDQGQFSFGNNVGGMESTSEEEDDEGFSCGASEEQDPEAPPLCHVESGNSPTPPPQLFSSSALESIGISPTWESKSQKETFSWSEPSDPINHEQIEKCDDDNSANLPTNFWQDMCSQIKTGENMKVINLALNPERNTGYNGTHIWNAIYEENCLIVDGLNATEEMCYEERVLYRLLSGLHTSTTLSIAKNYYPPSERKKRKHWEPNTQFFMKKFGEEPEHVRNLHFSYVVLLRALRKASPFLYDYEIRTGDIVEDETASVLLKRLVDSHILSSCQGVFTAFDESLMFRNSRTPFTDPNSHHPKEFLLEENFKQVFHNISSILDCVQCQQCKLHGKMAMLGYGTALKILFLPAEYLSFSLSRNEIVAFINTLAKFSEALKEVRELTHLYLEQPPPASKEKKVEPKPNKEHISATQTNDAPISQQQPPIDFLQGGGNNAAIFELMDLAIGATTRLSKQGYISIDREEELVGLALEGDSKLMIVAKYFGADLSKFLLHSKHIGSSTNQQLGSNFTTTSNLPTRIQPFPPDAIVIGSGLAGLAASLNILDRGGRVIILEKEHLLGGNSAKASSGINGYNNDTAYGDTISIFRNDTIWSTGTAAQLPLIETLVQNSGAAVQWLKDRVGVDLSLRAQLGGHQNKRTHRPSNGMAGAEIIYALQRAVKKYQRTDMVTHRYG